MNKKNIKTNTSSKDNGNTIDATKCTTNKEFVTTIEKNIELRNKAKQNINKASDEILEGILTETLEDRVLNNPETMKKPWYKRGIFNKVVFKKITKLFTAVRA